MDMETFKSSMAAAANAEKSLREALYVLGVPERDLHQMRSRVLVNGRPIVVIGTWPTDVAEKVATALKLGAAQMQGSSTPA